MSKLYFLVASILITGSAVAQNPLMIPEALSGTSFELTLQNGSVEFTPGVTTATMGVNGDILGPTLIFEQGTTVDIAIHNEIDDTTTIHWHGMHIPAEMDGGPHTPFGPGETWYPTFTILDHASTMWYHPHLMHKTNKHIQMGIAGFVIIKDAEESSLALPRTYGIDDIPVVFQTKTIDAEGQIDTDMSNSGLDTLVLANGTPNAYFDAPAQQVRLRLLNGASERSFNLGLSDNAVFNVIGSDGGLLTAPAPLTRLLISPGERYEILVDLSDMQGESVQIINYGSTMSAGIYGTSNLGGPGMADPIPFYAENPLNGSDFTLLTLNVGSPTSNPVTTVPVALAITTDLEYTSVDMNRQITMAAVGGMMGAQALTGPFQLNGTDFDMNVVNIEVDLNNTEVWTLVNQSALSHPFHIHDIQFNIQEINGVPPPPHLQGWKDVVLVPSMMGSVQFITKFEDFADPEIPYMYHCHILIHEEGGMMGQFVVLDREGLIDDINDNIIKIYPNPAHDQINIEGHDGEVVIYDISGKIVIRDFGGEINIEKLNQGIYLIEYLTESTAKRSVFVVK